MICDLCRIYNITGLGINVRPSSLPRTIVASRSEYTLHEEWSCHSTGQRCDDVSLPSYPEVCDIHCVNAIITLQARLYLLWTEGSGMCSSITHLQTFFTHTYT